MLTKPQMILLQTARRQVPSLREDARWRMVLRNVARVESSRELTNRSLEDVLALLEELGFRAPSKRPDHYRRKVASRGQTVSDEQLYKMGAMAHEAGLDLDGFCRRMSAGRTDNPSELEPLEAYNVIEALKAIINRNQDASGGDTDAPVTTAPAATAPAGDHGASDSNPPASWDLPLEDDVPF